MSVVATLDHVVVNTRDNLVGAAELWQRLGFALTPMGRHTLGSANHLAMFGTDYLELIGAPAARTDLPPMQWPAGLNALVFGTEDAARTYVSMQAAGVPADPPLDFSRPVEAAGGAAGGAAASFRTVNLQPGLAQSGRIYFCEHRTRALVWRDEWRVHPNGVVGIESATIVARDPRGMGDLFADLFGPDAVGGIPGGLRLACALTRIEVIERVTFERQWGQSAFPDMERPEAMAALTFRTMSRTKVRAALRSGGVMAREESGRIVVDAADAGGVALAFVE